MGLKRGNDLERRLGRDGGGWNRRNLEMYEKRQGLGVN